jgi:TPR repeat protein
VQIGRYEVLEELGRGGMGAVYKARDPATGHDVAIKVLLGGIGATSQQRTRFDREARALAKVNHRNVVRLLDVGEHESAPFLVLEYHKEGSLTEALRSTELSPALAVRIGLQLAAGLEASHAQGVLHRDLKPDNVLLGAHSLAMLTDFGLAKDLDRQGETQRLSQSGIFLGTPGFWAPEQAAGKIHECGPAVDVYGLGAVLYYVLCGQPPIGGEGLLAVLTATLEEKPPAIRSLRPEVPRELESVIMRCLEKEPADRWSSVSALKEALLEFETQAAPDKSGAGRGALALVPGAIALALGGAMFLLGQWRAVEPAPPVDAPRPASSPSLTSLFERGSVEFEAKRYGAALPWLRRAAERGHVKAMANLAVMLEKGHGVAKDEAEAVKWYRLAAEKGNATAMTYLGSMLARGRGVAKDETEATKWYRRAAEAGNAAAMTYLGSMLLWGRGVAKDEAEAAKWWRRAAQKGHLAAMPPLAGVLAHGRGVVKDEIESVQWWRRAAEKGHVSAMLALALALETSRGVAKDETEAAKWYRRAAEKGNPTAMTNLGVALAKGSGVPKDWTEAVKWWRRAAKNGHTGAMTNLGMALMKGRGASKDETEAAKLYRRAAEKGNPTAMFYLASYLETGRGVAKDEAEAVIWFRRAAEKGSARVRQSALKELKRLGQ